MLEISKLKRVKPIDNKAPDIWHGDIKWSKIFEKAARRFDKRITKSGLCLAVSEALGSKWGYDTKDGRQEDRMAKYVGDLLGEDQYVEDWLRRHNPGKFKPLISNLFMNEYRAAWARHLAKQFRDKGL